MTRALSRRVTCGTGAGAPPQPGSLCSGADGAQRRSTDAHTDCLYTSGASRPSELQDTAASGARSSRARLRDVQMHEGPGCPGPLCWEGYLCRLGTVGRLTLGAWTFGRLTLGA